MNKKILSLALATVILATSSISAFGAVVDPGQSVPIDVSGSTGTVPVNVTATAAKFSVTVPTALPVDMSEMGIITVSDTAAIINNSPTSVKVTNIAVSEATPWKIAAYTAKDCLQNEKVNTKKVAFSISNETATLVNGEKTKVWDADGKPETPDVAGISFVTANWAAIGGDATPNDTTDPATAVNTMKLVYDASLPAQTAGIAANTSVMNVIFTIGWDEAPAI